MYSLRFFRQDLIAGTTVAVIALPLALAFGYASGVGAAAGLYSAIAAGLAASLFGGSRFQISGPTGGMVAVLVLVVSQYGVEKALIAGLMAGIFQIAFGLTKLGQLIRYVPFSVTTGFTAGIAVVIVASQKTNIAVAPLVVLATVLLSFAIRKISPKLPASLITLITVTAAIELMGIQVPKLGSIPTTLPLPQIPQLSLSDVRELFKPALILAVLGSIESLLSAVVADGMTTERHDSNRELIGQGVGNIVAPLFGGIAATGAIARTAVNISAGAKTRAAGVIHGLVILLMIVFISPLAAKIPLSVLAGVLVVAAIRMIEWENIALLYKSSRGALAVMGLTLAVTIFVDLVTAVEVGLIAASALFIYRMSDLGLYRDELAGDNVDVGEIAPKADPRIVVYRVDGPLFFGAVEKFIKVTTAHPNMRFLILGMRQVPLIDTTGIMGLQSINRKLKKRQGCQLLISELQDGVEKQLKKSPSWGEVGRENIFESSSEAMEAAQARLSAQPSVVEQSPLLGEQGSATV